MHSKRSVVIINQYVPTMSQWNGHVGPGRVLLGTPLLLHIILIAQ